MSNSLSEKLNLRVNDYPIILNERFNQSALREHNIRKMGWFLRRKIKPSHIDFIYWAKNCVFRYINDWHSNIITPNLDTESGTIFMFGTSAFLYYQKQTLVNFSFQIIRNQMMAEGLLEKFEQRITKSDIAHPSSIRTGVKVWELDNQTLIVEYPPQNKQHGWIHLRFTSIPVLPFLD